VKEAGSATLGATERRVREREVKYCGESVRPTYLFSSSIVKVNSSLSSLRFWGSLRKARRTHFLDLCVCVWMRAPRGGKHFLWSYLESFSAPRRPHRHLRCFLIAL